MTIRNINVTGIRDAVGDANRTGADNWAIVLDMSDWSVREHDLIGNDWIETTWPTVQIASGHGNSIFGRDKTSMAELTDIIDSIMGVRERANAEYDSGMRHEWAESPDDETKAQYRKQEVCDYLAND